MHNAQKAPLLGELIALLCFFTTLPATIAQVTVYNSGVATHIESGLNVTINGGFTNQTQSATDGSLDNEGTLNVSGDWTNTAGNNVFSSASGSVVLNGTAASQTIGGSAATDFYDLTLNNTFGTSPEIVVDVNTNVENTLTMTSGNVNLSSNTLAIGSAAGSPGSLSHASGHIYGGNIARWFNTSTIADGSNAGLFPIGNGTDYRPLYVSVPSTAPTTGGTITASHTNASSVSDVSFADGGSTVTRRHNSFWGASIGDGLSGGTFNLRVEGTGFGDIGDVNDLRLTLAGSTIGNAGTNGGTTANPQVNRTGLSAAELSNSFYMASVDAANSPLPVELGDFNAVLKEGVVHLHWMTFSERNNDFFTIEKTRDGVNFEEVTETAGSGTRNTPRQYTAVDRNPYKGTSYYRLKQTDFNGHYTYSELVKVRYMEETAFRLYPNPLKGNRLHLSTRGMDIKNGAVLELYNSSGKKLYVETIEGTHGTGELTIKLPREQLLPGIYHVVVTTTINSYKQKLVVH